MSKRKNDMTKFLGLEPEPSHDGKIIPESWVHNAPVNDIVTEAMICEDSLYYLNDEKNVSIFQINDQVFHDTVLSEPAYKDMYGTSMVDVLGSAMDSGEPYRWEFVEPDPREVLKIKVDLAGLDYASRTKVIDDIHRYIIRKVKTYARHSSFVKLQTNQISEQLNKIHNLPFGTTLETYG